MEQESDVGRIIVEQLNNLPPEHRIAYLLLYRYYENYKQVYDAPCWPAFNALRKPGEHEFFPVFIDLADYLRGRGIAIGNQDVPWQSYIRFALEWFHSLEQIPAPLQLKNPVLLRRFLQTNPVVETERCRAEFAPPTRALIPELRTYSALRLLGLA